MDIVIVLDGSNSIYPWDPMNEFLQKLLPELDIGPQNTQVMSCCHQLYGDSITGTAEGNLGCVAGSFYHTRSVSFSMALNPSLNSN